MSDSRRAHWQSVYDSKDPKEVSWYQPVPERSLQLIREIGVPKSDPVLDVGGGASTLVDNLLQDGYSDISVLDISGNALDRSRARLGKSADAVDWIEADVTTFVPPRQYTLWHDRAVFHFLTDPADRNNYIDVATRAITSNGYLVLATFGPEGPQRCSGLEIRRYSVHRLQDLFGDHFRLGGHHLEDHRTPMGSTQQFLYSWWQARS